MSGTVSVTARISEEDRKRLEALSESTGRTKGYIIAKAIRDYLDTQAWQIEEIRKGIEEAESGDFATDEEMEVFLAKWRL